ncbi:Exosome complex exonuclease RRP42 [Gracilariopsis chorda]|uniref:Ribosomal RNA-processing protein 42 n=1 Tax=Gracilariopsis chorda TaxID=448386 RepID=A0A2V3IHV9_9FLOR|nr:Exosome complex exonuclease RRP42 [Gracilariopsis chorda]|eukprot:PXF41613.1 Exosome complex exonuclease RRP42 [Gracilariopsis chorda]
MQFLSDAECEYIRNGAKDGIRSDGRAMLDIRPVTLETTVLPTASGSARVRIGKVTDILVGIKPEVAEPSQDFPDEGIISFTVECSSLASPDFVGRGGADLSAELGQLLTRLYTSPVTRELRRSLSIIKGKKCWILHIDALVLDSGGNLFGALSLAVRAALRVVILPRVIVIPGEADDDDEIEVDEEEFKMLERSRDAPIAVTLASQGDRGIYMADCTSEEESCATASITMGVSPLGKSCGAVSAGTGGIDLDTLSSMLKDAAQLGLEILDATDRFLKTDIDNRMSGAPIVPIGFFS